MELLIYLNKSTSINFGQVEEIETNDENPKANDELLDRDKIGWISNETQTVHVQKRTRVTRKMGHLCHVACCLQQLHNSTAGCVSSSFNGLPSVHFSRCYYQHRVYLRHVGQLQNDLHRRRKWRRSHWSQRNCNQLSQVKVQNWLDRSAAVGRYCKVLNCVRQFALSQLDHFDQNDKSAEGLRRDLVAQSQRRNQGRCAARQDPLPVCAVPALPRLSLVLHCRAGRKLVPANRVLARRERILRRRRLVQVLQLSAARTTDVRRWWYRASDDVSDFVVLILYICRSNAWGTVVW